MILPCSTTGASASNSARKSWCAEAGDRPANTARTIATMTAMRRDFIFHHPKKTPAGMARSRQAQVPPLGVVGPRDTHQYGQKSPTPRSGLPQNGHLTPKETSVTFRKSDRCLE